MHYYLSLVLCIISARTRKIGTMLITDRFCFALKWMKRVSDADDQFDTSIIAIRVTNSTPPSKIFNRLGLLTQHPTRQLLPNATLMNFTHSEFYLNKNPSVFWMNHN